MVLKKIISFFILLTAHFSVFSQDETHTFLGSASDASEINGTYFSWSLGEVVVFNQENDVITQPFFAQGMQTYLNIPRSKCFNLSVNPANPKQELCSGTTAFVRNLTVKFTPAQPDAEIQWYYAETSSEDSSLYAKVAGATDTTFKPYFPGNYMVCISSRLKGCTECSESFQVTLGAGQHFQPYISPQGYPANTITANYDPTIAPGAISVQWYAYLPGLNKFLLVAGGTKQALKVRYNGEYMAVISYSNGCKLSAVHKVNGYNKPLQRATDTWINGNTIYIPEEDFTLRQAVNVYPNPAMHQFTVTLVTAEENAGTAELISNTGLFVKTILLKAEGRSMHTAQVSTEDLSAGVYFLKVSTGERQLIEKVVIYK